MLFFLAPRNKWFKYFSPLKARWFAGAPLLHGMHCHENVFQLKMGVLARLAKHMKTCFLGLKMGPHYVSVRGGRCVTEPEVKP